MSLDLSTYSDEELAALRAQIGLESVRRAQLRDLPEQARQNAVEYMALGGNPADLIAAVNDATTTPTLPDRKDSAARR